VFSAPAGCISRAWRGKRVAMTSRTSSTPRPMKNAVGAPSSENPKRNGAAMKSTPAPRSISTWTATGIELLRLVGPSVLAMVCRQRGIQLVTFSSDLVFDGATHRPYVESDPVAPLNIYGRTKAEAERRVLALAPGALVIRTSAFFGPSDRANFVTRLLETLSAGGTFRAASDAIVSPTYVPDLVDRALDLLIDGASGVDAPVHRRIAEQQPA